MEYILASNNKGKILEFKSSLGIEIKTLEEAGITEDVEEFGVTFEQNALIKAQAISKLFPDAIIISDDSGLEVRALDFAPGIYSKRFSGKDVNVDEENNKLLLEKLTGIEDRFSRFRTVLCVYNQKLDICNFYNGIVEGEIADHFDGEHGFGYDPVFIYQGKTFGSIPRSEKHKVSHRGRAIEKLKKSGILNV